MTTSPGEKLQKRLARPGEVGEAIGMIFQIPDSIAGRFEGYTDAAANEKKSTAIFCKEGDACGHQAICCAKTKTVICGLSTAEHTFRWKSDSTVSTMGVVDEEAIFPG